jgi:ketosteroid isomerase-like protein
MALTEEQMIDRVRASLDAFNRGDFEAAAEVAHPDIAFLRPGGQSELRGSEALRGWMEPDAFESQTLDPDLSEAAGNKVLVRQRAVARGAGSGIEIEIDTWAVWTFDEDGLVTRIEGYLPYQEAEARRAFLAS